MIAIWGGGYIGLSTALYFAREEVKSLIVDIDADKVDKINKGICPISRLESWVGLKLAPYVEAGYIRATIDWEEAKEIDTNFVCVNTEKYDKPYYGAIEDVISKIPEENLVIVESTMAPGATDKYILPTHDRVCIAPRRDWYTIEWAGTLPDMARVYGASNDEVARESYDILSIVCNNLVRAKDYKYAEMTKSVENMLRHIHCVVAQQLALAYPSYNIDEVLRLASTKWNVPRLYASLRTGGYCIPLSSKYVVEGAEIPEHLSMLHSATSQDNTNTLYYMRELIEKFKELNVKRVAVMGLSYLGDIPVSQLSPANLVINLLKKNDYEVGLNDDYFSTDEMLNSVGNVIPLRFPEGLKDYQALILICCHKYYSEIPYETLLRYIREVKLIFDNHKCLIRHKERFEREGIEYYTPAGGGLFTEEAEHDVK